MTAKGAKDVLQHPILDGITKGLILLLVGLVGSGVGDIAEIKQEMAVQGQQLGSMLKTVDDRAGQNSRIVALEVGSASKDQIQSLKDSMAIMNVELRELIEVRIRALEAE